ncbi:hypothetical protein ACWCYZ_42940 [Streptomyces virginiae]
MQFLRLRSPGDGLACATYKESGRIVVVVPSGLCVGKSSLASVGTALAGS